MYDLPDDDMPETNGVVRMRVPIAGFEFIPDAQDANKCTCKHIIECGLSGYIPNSVQALVIKDTAWGLVLLQKLMPKYLEGISDD